MPSNKKLRTRGIRNPTHGSTWDNNMCCAQIYSLPCMYNFDSVDMFTIPHNMSHIENWFFLVKAVSKVSSDQKVQNVKGIRGKCTIVHTCKYHCPLGWSWPARCPSGRWGPAPRRPADPSPPPPSWCRSSSSRPPPNIVGHAQSKCFSWIFKSTIK